MKQSAMWVRPLNLPNLIETVLIKLETDDSVVVLEGRIDLSNFPFELVRDLPNSFRSEASDAETRVALGLVPGKGRLIFLCLSKDQDWSSNISAMQVYINDERAFLAGDDFHEECISIWPAAPEKLVQQLRQEKVAL